MFIYNVTIKVDASIHDQWLNWMKETHIPAVMSSGCFEKFVLVRLLETDETEGPTYAVQYFALSRAQYNRYIEMHATRLRKESSDQWGERFIAFRTLMEVID
ncbi:MAG: hypothetical protein K0Q66_917 [Chitinophagaceae bacterium]|jgi:hypothetical protein|nr:hypothetical protein [Chitinophagaceae bacterium]